MGKAGVVGQSGTPYRGHCDEDLTVHNEATIQHNVCEGNQTGIGDDLRAELKVARGGSKTDAPASIEPTARSRGAAD